VEEQWGLERAGRPSPSGEKIILNDAKRFLRRAAGGDLGYQHHRQGNAEKSTKTYRLRGDLKVEECP